MIEGNGPGKNIGGFHVKDEKKSGNKIKGNWISKSSRPGGNDATLIGPQLFRIRFLFPEPARDDQEGDDEDPDHQSKNGQGENPWLPGRQNVY
jgi:hypothetical protein